MQSIFPLGEGLGRNIEESVFVRHSASQPDAVVSFELFGDQEIPANLDNDDEQSTSVHVPAQRAKKDTSADFRVYVSVPGTLKLRALN
jgi:hypothetical protein